MEDQKIHIPDYLKSPGGAHQKLPSAEEVLKMLDSMKGIPEAELESLRESLMKKIKNPNAMAVERTSLEYMVFLTMITFVIFLFVFFGYKLYKSLVEKQKKREEKLKAKQMKKKK